MEEVWHDGNGTGLTRCEVEVAAEECLLGCGPEVLVGLVEGGDRDGDGQGEGDGGERGEEEQQRRRRLRRGRWARRYVCSFFFFLSFSTSPLPFLIFFFIFFLFTSSLCALPILSLPHRPFLSPPISSFMFFFFPF